jgi:hypothetical protein
MGVAGVRYVGQADLILLFSVLMTPQPMPLMILMQTGFGEGAKVGGGGGKCPRTHQQIGYLFMHFCM